MNYKKNLKTEIFFKILSKGIGFGKSILLLFLFGFSKQLDSFYLALSLTGIVLSMPVVYELLYMSDLKAKIETKNNELILNSFLQFAVVVISCSLLCFILVLFFYEGKVLENFIIILLWAFLFNINSFNILVLRINQKYRLIGWYFLLFPVFITIVIVVGYYLFSFKNSIIASFSMLTSEFILVLLFYFKVNIKYFKSCRISISGFFNNKKVVQILKSFTLISAVYIIDITDKSFSYQLNGGYTTVLIYGALLPLMVRQALDFKSVFYHKLQYSFTIKSDLQILWQTLKWLCFLLLPIMILLFLSSHLVEMKYISDYIKIDVNQYNDLINVFMTYILILPVYIIWDMMYRIFYKNDYLNKLFLIMFIGVVLNYVLNYIFVNLLIMNAFGIALSTLIVMVIYCLYSLLYLKFKETKESITT